MASSTSSDERRLDRVHDDPAMQRSAALNRHILQLTRTLQTMKSHVACSGTDGVSWATYVLLFHLTTGGPPRAKTLAETACVDPSTISRQVDQLVRPVMSSARPTPTTAGPPCSPPPTRTSPSTAGCRAARPPCSPAPCVRGRPTTSSALPGC